MILVIEIRLEKKYSSIKRCNKVYFKNVFKKLFKNQSLNFR